MKTSALLALSVPLSGPRNRQVAPSPPAPQSRAPTTMSSIPSKSATEMANPKKSLAFGPYRSSPKSLLA